MTGLGSYETHRTLRNWQPLYFSEPFKTREQTREWVSSIKGLGFGDGYCTLIDK